MTCRPIRAAPAILPLALALAGCAGGPAPAPHVAPPPPVVAVQPGLAGAIGRTAAALMASLGTPTLDIKEGPARKLQFRGPACVLDAYLYPPAGGGEPRATWIDARTAGGADTDRAACLAALSLRPTIPPAPPHPAHARGATAPRR